MKLSQTQINRRHKTALTDTIKSWENIKPRFEALLGKCLVSSPEPGRLELMAEGLDLGTRLSNVFRRLNILCVEKLDEPSLLEAERTEENG